MTNFDAGLFSRGIPLPSGGELVTMGAVFHVDSGHANGADTHAGTNPEKPKVTIDSAINAATANNGDIILVAAGHAESIANATSLVPDIAGIKIFGLGRGADRPTITFTNAAGNIPISGASVEFHNVLFTVSGTTDVVAGITVSGADALLMNCEMREGASTAQFVDAIVGTTCDRLEVVNFKFRGLVAGDATQAAISITGTPDEVKLINHWIVGEFAAAAIDITGVATELFMKDLVIRQEHATQDACITVAGTATGFLIGAKLRAEGVDDSAITDALTATNDLQIYDLQIVNTDGETALIGSSEVTTLDTGNQAWGAPSVVD